jgi:hypothetical protein
MKCIYTRLLGDEELRPHLERGDSIAFKGLGHAWQEIELQVERLGFGTAYAVSRTKSGEASSEQDSARVSPVRKA